MKSNVNQLNRMPFIDWLRGFSVFLMIVYHLCYDLDMFGYIDTIFGRGYWIPFRYIIVILFLTLVGASLVFAHHKGIRWSNVRKRSLQLLLASIAVTISSYFIAPSKVTVFGILHFILVASFLVLPLINKPKLAMVIGVVIFIAGHLIATSMFEPFGLHWIGMVENKRPALDYVPVFPWLGMVLIGIAIGHWFIRSETGHRFSTLDLTNTHSVGLFKYVHILMHWLGRHSLVIYLVHQPLLFGAFYSLEWL